MKTKATKPLTPEQEAKRQAKIDKLQGALYDAKLKREEAESVEKLARKALQQAKGGPAAGTIKDFEDSIQARFEDAKAIGFSIGQINSIVKRKLVML